MGQVQLEPVDRDVLERARRVALERALPRATRDHPADEDVLDRARGRLLLGREPRIDVAAALDVEVDRIAVTPPEPVAPGAFVLGLAVDAPAPLERDVLEVLPVEQRLRGEVLLALGRVDRRPRHQHDAHVTPELDRPRGVRAGREEDGAAAGRRASIDCALDRGPGIVAAPAAGAVVASVEQVSAGPGRRGARDQEDERRRRRESARQGRPHGGSSGRACVHARMCGEG